MSIGIKLGRGVGALGALAVHGAVRSVEGLGTFGSDIVTGVEQGYESKSAYLAMPVEVRKAQRDAARAELAQRRAPIAAAPAKAKRATA
jgi:hypothetical protein